MLELPRRPQSRRQCLRKRLRIVLRRQPWFLLCSVPNGTKTAFKVDDGTAGLRRSGVLKSDYDCRRLPLLGLLMYMSYRFRCRRRLHRAASLLRVLPNVVSAQHRWARTKHPVTKGWLPLPGNVISLAAASGSSSYMEFPPIENSSP